MADRRQVKRSIRQLQYVKTWQLVVLLLLAGFVSATFLRLNNIGMVERRDAVLAADKDGDATIIQTRLYDLQRYVSAHMNADMGSIYLEAQYKRDSQKMMDAAGADGNPNGNIFKKAQETCAPKNARFGGYSTAYEQCVISELSKYPSASELTTTLSLPRADSYRHSFISPLWSPDFAGWTVLATLLIIVMIVARMIGLLTLRTILKMRDR